MGKKDKVLTAMLLVVLAVCIAATIYLIITPKPTEPFTEFYILGPNGKAADYPHYLRKGEKASVIIGIVNHEHRTLNYTITVWLVNESFNNGSVTVHHIYLMKVMHVRLKSIPVRVEGNWTPEWQGWYNFSVNRTGKFKLWFLLFKHNVTLPNPENGDYVNTSVRNWIVEASNVSSKILSLNLNLVVR